MPLPEELPLWAYGYAAAFVLVHGVVLYYLYWSTASAPSDDAADAETEATTVVCDHCGTENDHEYRYCRNCVQELSGASELGDAESKPVSPGIL